MENPQDISASFVPNGNKRHSDSDSDSKEEIRQAQNESSEGSGDTNPNQADSEASSPSSSSFWKQSLWSTQQFQQRWDDMVQNACTVSPCHLWEVPLEPPVVTVYSTDEAPHQTNQKPNGSTLPTTVASLASLTVIAKVSGSDSVRPAHAAIECSVQEGPKTLAEKRQQRVPLETLHVRQDQTLALERNISELTMRSCYTATLPLQPQNPEQPSKPQRRMAYRMAYYAVGKHHQQAGRGGNRRCYFTGKLIMDGTPFYAGSVEQGLRTLVVFCLPSALGLPGPDVVRQFSRPSSSGGRRSFLSNGASRKGPESVTSRSWASRSLAGSRVSRMSSLDDLSMSVDGDLDLNWSLDRDMLLRVLPPANKRLLQQMADMYGDQFETLPVQVRAADVWKLYVKFCFFSGLPIAEGDLHYKVRDVVAEAMYGEEIALSHDVMEASTSSAEILSLPNRVVLQYLRQNYTQQCSKLDDRVFQRENWERVAPEV